MPLSDIDVDFGDDDAPKRKFKARVPDAKIVKAVVLGVVAIVLIYVLWSVLSGALGAIGSFSITPAVDVKFTKPKLMPGSSTEMVVTVTNILREDAKDVEILVTPESNVITVNGTNPIKEKVIGASSQRLFVFDLTVKEGITKGTYKIATTATLNERIEEKLSYLQVE